LQNVPQFFSHQLQENVGTPNLSMTVARMFSARLLLRKYDSFEKVMPDVISSHDDSYYLVSAADVGGLSPRFLVGFCDVQV
jgi:hypothetical protein